VANGLRYLRTLRVRASIHDRLYSMLSHLLLCNRIEKVSGLILYAFISQSLTFLLNSRSFRFRDTNIFILAPLLPKLHGHFAEFLKCCSPITLAFSARILESDLVRLHNFQPQISHIRNHVC